MTTGKLNLTDIEQFLQDAAKEHNAHILAASFPPHSLQALNAGALPKPPVIYNKTLRSGPFQGYVAVTPEEEPNLPASFSVEKKSEKLTLLKDSQGRFVTSDLDLFAVFNPNNPPEEVFEDPIYSFTTQTEKNIIVDINKRAQEFGVVGLIAHGSSVLFRPVEEKTIKWPLTLYANGKVSCISTWKALVNVLPEHLRAYKKI